MIDRFEEKKINVDDVGLESARNLLNSFDEEEYNCRLAFNHNARELDELSSIWKGAEANRFRSQMREELESMAAETRRLFDNARSEMENRLREYEKTRVDQQNEKEAGKEEKDGD